MKATLWMTGALLSFCLLAIGARELSADIDIFQSLFIRSLIGLILATAIIVTNKGYELLSTHKIKYHLTRNLFHYLGQYGWFVGIGLLPLAEVFAIEFTVPLWTLIIAVIFLGESVTTSKMAAITLGIAGVYTILQPGTEIIKPASLVVLAAAIGFSISLVTTKFLSNTESSLTIIFYMCLIQLPIGLLCSIPNWTTPSYTQWFWLIIIGVVSLSAHYSISQAMRHAEASMVSTLDFFRLPLIMLVGYALYDEAVHVTVLLGAALMLLSNIINIKGAVANRGVLDKG